MKPATLLRTLIPALLAVGINVQAQTTVSTTPVGFVSTTLPTSGFTYVGVSLTIPPVLTGSNTTLSGNTVGVGIDLDAALDSSKAYAMEIKEGDLEGYAEDIDSWTGQDLTLKSDLEAAIVAGGYTAADDFNGKRISIRELPTIASIFGETNSAGLREGNLATADNIYLFSQGNFTRYYYSNGGIGAGTPGWKDETGADAGSTPVHFGDGIIIQTNDSAPKEIVISGSVKLGPTNVPIYSGYNLISNTSPVEGNLTLDNSGIAPPAITAGNSATADIVFIYDGSGGFDEYYYSNGGIGAGSPGWKDDTGADAGSTPLPDGGSFFIFRRTTQTSVTLPQDLPN